MSYKELKSPHGKFHPAQVAEYKSKIGMSQPRSFSKTQYDGLTDKSTYAEYAWEFLRRNKFYQTLIDAASDNKVPHYPLPSWGYRQSSRFEEAPTWEYHCGLWSKPYKHYSETYTTDIAWYPIEHMLKNMRGELGRSEELQDRSTQLQITIDLGHKFGPGVSGIKKQLEIAEQAITVFHKKLKSTSCIGQLEANRTSKAVLRRYLYIADLFTGERSIKKEIDKRNDSGEVPMKRVGTRVLSVKEIAAKINSKKIQYSATTDSIGKDADEAFAYIYQWKCLNLLTLADNP
jgi:hypothetical protein